MHELAFPLLVGLVLLALAFDFLNGLHDAANSIATVVATRLLKPVQAVMFAAFFNFAADAADSSGDPRPSNRNRSATRPAASAARASSSSIGSSGMSATVTAGGAAASTL